MFWQLLRKQKQTPYKFYAFGTKVFSASYSDGWRASLIKGNGANNGSPQSISLAPCGLVISANWLRDHCNCQKCIHPDNRQKLHSSADRHANSLVKSLSIKNGQTLQVEWQDLAANGHHHSSLYSLDWIKKAYTIGLGPQDQNIVHWSATELLQNDLLLKLDYQTYMNDEKGLLQALSTLDKIGLIILKNVPIDNEEEIRNVVERINPIRNSFYGETWNVKSVAGAKNIAYTALELGLHMDLMYFETPPGLQFLHSLKHSVKGGESTFVDSFKAAFMLKDQNPRFFDILCKVPVSFHYKHKNSHYYKYTRTTISESLYGNHQSDKSKYLNIFYAPPFQGPIDPTLVREQGGGYSVDDFYEAFQAFEKIINSPQMVLKIRLDPGDCAIFHNRRTLHGRSSFDPSQGERFFKGCYLDLDDFKSRLRTLRDKHKGLHNK